MTKKPKPIATVEICSVCGESWPGHLPKGAKRDVTTDDCLRVLQAALVQARRPINGVWGSPVSSGSSAFVST
jgi:hypothetical protein